MVDCFPDTQDKTPAVPIELSRVGVKGVKKLLTLNRGEKLRPIVLIPTFDAYVDLPSDQKGIHMSRTPEAISEVIEEVTTSDAVEVESICAEIVENMMLKHEYARKIEVEMVSDYMFNRKSPITEKNSQEMGKLIAKAVGIRDKDKITIRKSIGAEVVGMTVCPCAQETVKEVDKNKLLEFLDEETTEKVIDTVTFASHNQRGVGTILIEVPKNQKINADTIIEIIESSMSSPVCGLLKRPDENATVMNAHQKPVFVEDCVRNMVERIIDEFSYLPDDTIITICQLNKESIHRHDAFAEKVATMAELKEEMKDVLN